MSNVTNIIIAGLGGQGVLKASDILGDVAFAAGRDVKKAEIHGMSQRGGSVTSDVRYGASADERVWSPMVPRGQVDYLVVLSADQAEVNRHMLKPDGVLIDPSWAEPCGDRVNPRSINVALLGALSSYLEFTREAWLAAVFGNLAEKLHAMNERAFDAGREAAEARRAAAL